MYQSLACPFAEVVMAFQTSSDCLLGRRSRCFPCSGLLCFPICACPSLHIVCMYVFFVQNVVDLLIHFIAANLLLCCVLVTHYTLNILWIPPSPIQLLQRKLILDPRLPQHKSIWSATAMIFNTFFQMTLQAAFADEVSLIHLELIPLLIPRSHPYESLPKIFCQLCWSDSVRELSSQM